MVKAGACRFDPLAHFLPLVAGQIVHDDDVALAQLRHEDALDIGREGEPIDRTVEHERRDHAACGQAGDEGRRRAQHLGAGARRGGSGRGSGPCWWMPRSRHGHEKTPMRRSIESGVGMSAGLPPADSLMMWTPPHRPAAMMPIGPKRDRERLQ